MPRTDDQLMRDMVEVSGDRASMYRRRLPPENSPTYAALHWWMSLEDIEDEGNRATLDGFTVSWPWSDYTAAVVTIGHRAICMTAVPHERHPEIAYVQFVHSCIEPGCTTGEVRIDDIYYLALINVRHGRTRWEADRLWRIWHLTYNQTASPEELKTSR